MLWFACSVGHVQLPLFASHFAACFCYYFLFEFWLQDFPFSDVPVVRSRDVPLMLICCLGLLEPLCLLYILLYSYGYLSILLGYTIWYSFHRFSMVRCYFKFDFLESSQSLKDKMGIKFLLLVNKQGQTRLSQYYEYKDVQQRCTDEAEIIRKCLARNENQVGFSPL